MPKKITVSLLALLVLMLPGCGFKDIDKRFFVVAIGVDQGERAPFKVSFKLAIPSPRTEPGEAKYQVISQEGSSIANAVRLMKSKVDKEFDFGHTTVIVIGKSFADHRELGRSLDWFFRRRDIQEIAFMAIGEPDALSIIQTKPKSERLAGNALMLPFTNEGTESPYIVKTYLFDYYRRWHEHGRDAFLPIVSARSETFVINRAAIFSMNSKKLELTPKETSIFNQFLKTRHRFLILAARNGKQISFNAKVRSLRFKLNDSASKPEIRYRISINVESEDAEAPVFHQSWDELEKTVEEEFSNQALQLLNKFRDKGVDPLGFGLRYRASRHGGKSDFAEWQKIYPKVTFKVNVNAHFTGTGIIE